MEKTMNFTVEGNPVWFFGITGTVKGLQNWSDTAVSSSTNASGNIQISSNTTNRQSVWIVSDNGREHEVKNANVSCRDGQRVTLIWGASQGTQDGYYTIFFNHNTNMLESFPLVVSQPGFKSCYATKSEWIFLIISLLCCVFIITIPIFFITYSIVKNRTINRTKIYQEFSKKLLENSIFMKEIY